MKFSEIKHKIKNLGNFKSLGEIKKAGLRLVRNTKTGDYWLIEEEFLIPVLKTAKDSKNLFLDPKTLPTSLFYCHKNETDLEKTKATEYIKWGKEQGYSKRRTLVSRQNWYDVGKHRPADAIILRRIGERMPVFRANSVLEDCNLFGIKRKQPQNIDFRVFLSILNSTLFRLFVELETRHLTGAQAVADTNVYIIEDTPLLNPKLIRRSEKLVRAYKTVEVRKSNSIFLESSIDPTKSIREQEPNPLPDRKVLDDVVFDALGLTKQERKEVYWAVCELVKNRLEKAKSV